MKERTLKSDFQQLSRNRHFLAISVLLFVAVFFWTGLTLFSSQHQTKIEQELQDMSIPLSPTLDIEAIKQIEKKRWIDKSELQSFTIYGLLTDSNGNDIVVPIDQLEQLTAQQALPQEIPAAEVASESGVALPSTNPATASASDEAELALP